MTNDDEDVAWPFPRNHVCQIPNIPYAQNHDRPQQLRINLSRPPFRTCKTTQVLCGPLMKRIAEAPKHTYYYEPLKNRGRRLRGTAWRIERGPMGRLRAKARRTAGSACARASVMFETLTACQCYYKRGRPIRRQFHTANWLSRDRPSLLRSRFSTFLTDQFRSLGSGVSGASPDFFFI